jgi:glucose-1-phosphate cytidylyltransferase
MQVVILCGGMGTRAYPYTAQLPKPMLPVAGQPILLHVMRIYASQGHREFILSLGYGKEVILDYFDHKQLDWNIHYVDTGAETDTGGRIEKLRDMLGERFMATYADGLSDVPLDELLAFHSSHNGCATVTSVPLISQYGTIDFEQSGRIRAFREKPVLRQHWINAGFFVFDREVFDRWEGSNLERDVLPRLAEAGLMYAYRHDGFFKSMDTFKDQQEIDRLCRNARAPWVRHACVPAETRKQLDHSMRATV